MKQANLQVFQRSCRKCKRDFEVDIIEPQPSVRWWLSVPLPVYCSECRLDWRNATNEAHYQAFNQEIDSGELRAMFRGHLLDTQGLVSIANQQSATNSVTLPELFNSAEVSVEPPDWWHIHVARVAEQLLDNGWGLDDKSSIVFHVLPGGVSVRWTGELPTEALPELLKLGLVWPVVEAVRNLKGKAHRRVHRQLCRLARSRLADPEPRIRFEALWVLRSLDFENVASTFFQVAADSNEHPRVRGLALEGIEMIDRRIPSSKREVNLTQRTVKLIEGLLSVEDPEVLWWACYVCSHICPWRSACTHGRCRLVKRSFNKRLAVKLRRLINDPRPAGLGWSVGKEAGDAIAWLEEFRPLPDRPKWLPYDPWGSV